MNFYTKKRRMPQVIIVSLIDIFAILLIFVIVTTTFKGAQPFMSINPGAKPASSANQANDRVVVTLGKDNEIFLNEKKITGEQLKEELRKLVKTNTTSKLDCGYDPECSMDFLNQVSFIFHEEGLNGITLYTGVEQKQ